MSKLVTVEQLAEELHYSKDRIRVLARAGKIPGAVKRGRAWLFKLDVVLADFLGEPVAISGDLSDDEII